MASGLLRARSTLTFKAVALRRTRSLASAQPRKYGAFVRFAHDDPGPRFTCIPDVAPTRFEHPLLLGLPIESEPVGPSSRDSTRFQALADVRLNPPAGGPTFCTGNEPPLERTINSVRMDRDGDGRPVDGPEQACTALSQAHSALSGCVQQDRWRKSLVSTPMSRAC